MKKITVIAGSLILIASLLLTGCRRKQADPGGSTQDTLEASLAVDVSGLRSSDGQPLLLPPGSKNIPARPKDPSALPKEDPLHWYDMETNHENYPVSIADIGRDEWQPYLEVKEIRPEKAGELWERDGESNHRCVTYEGIVGLNVIWWGGAANTDRVDTGMIHNKNGWIRYFPHVEEIWGESAIQNDRYKAAQGYANEVARQALEFLDEMKENMPPSFSKDKP